MEKPIAIGIDLGTTNSCVGVFQFGAVEIIANSQGNKITPSYVAFTDTEQLVGEAAKNQMTQNPENTVYDAKRLIGRQFKDKLLQNDMKHFPFKLVNKGGKPQISVKYRKEDKIFNPEQISSMVLAEMKAIAESYLGTPVREAVITVPAYFNDAQRKATKDAGVIAGLNVLRMINEPTAAAIAFGVDKKTKSIRTVLVFDLGGGTFDVSILIIDDGFFEVKSTSGNTHLGGEDFDSRMVKYFADEFRKKSQKNISNDAKALRKLRTECELAKRTLSSHTETKIEIESLFEEIDFESSITRINFEKICEDLFKKTLEPVTKALADANLDKSKIDDIILVGGSTRIPKIQRMLQEFFNGKELNTSIHPEEAVAYGAAIHAATLNGHYEAQDLLLVDVTPLSLGIQTLGGKMEVIISRNTTIPVQETKIFSTAHNNQNSVLIQVFEGERTQTKDNKLLSRFQITGIPKAPAGLPQIEVTFEIGPDGILTASAVEKSSGKESQIKVENKDRFSKQEISRMIMEAQENRAADEEYRLRMNALTGLKNHLIHLKGVIQLESFNSIMSEDDRRQVENKIKSVEEWIDETSNAAKGDYLHMRKELEAVCNPVLNKFKQLNSGAASLSASSTSDRPRTVPLIEEIN